MIYPPTEPDPELLNGLMEDYDDIVNIARRYDKEEYVTKREIALIKAVAASHNDAWDTQIFTLKTEAVVDYNGDYQAMDTGTQWSPRRNWIDVITIGDVVVKLPEAEEWTPETL